MHFVQRMKTRNATQNHAIQFTLQSTEYNQVVPWLITTGCPKQ